MSRASVNQRVSIAAEATAGIPVFPNRELPSLSIEMTREMRTQFYRKMGQKFPTSGAKHREKATGSFSGSLDFNEVIYPLSGLFGAPTPVQIGATAGYTWTFDPKSSLPDSGKTFTCKWGDTTVCEQVNHAVFNSLTISATNDDCSISGDVFARAVDNTASPYTTNASDIILMDEVQKIAITGSPTGGTFTITYSSQTTSALAYNATAAQIKAALQALSNIADADVEVYGGQLPSNAVYIWFKGALKGTNVAQVTTTDSLTGGSSPATAITTEQAGAATVTQIAQQPVSLSQVNLTLDSSYGGIGTTKYCQTLSVEVAIPNKQQPVEVLCTDYPDFKDAVELPIEGARIRVVMTYEAAIATLINSLNTASRVTYFLRIQAVGANIGASADYTFRADFAVQLANVTTRNNEQGTYAVELEFQIVHDATMGGAMDFVVVNTRSAL